MGINRQSPLVGILDSAELPVERHELYLSAAELHDSCAIHNPRRKEEWFAGRMAAKFVFLQGAHAGDSGQSAELCVQSITARMLADFTPQKYRDVIVSKDKSPGGGPARVGWLAGGDTVHVAISHVNGLACAFIGGTDLYSVDLEARAARVPEFYLHNFTQGERSWTGDCARSFDLDRDWLYTLLWSAKECLLKTPAFASFSLWDMPSIEVNIFGGGARLQAIQHADSLSGNFEFLQAEAIFNCRTDSRCSPWPFRLAFSGTAHLVLTAITKTGLRP